MWYSYWNLASIDTGEFDDVWTVMMCCCVVVSPVHSSWSWSDHLAGRATKTRLSGGENWVVFMPRRCQAWSTGWLPQGSHVIVCLYQSQMEIWAIDYRLPADMELQGGGLQCVSNFWVQPVAPPSDLSSGSPRDRELLMWYNTKTSLTASCLFLFSHFVWSVPAVPGLNQIQWTYLDRRDCISRAALSVCAL